MEIWHSVYQAAASACLSYLSEDKCQQPRGRQSQSLSRPPKRWAVRTSSSSSRSRLKKHTQPLNDLGFIVQPISLLRVRDKNELRRTAKQRIKDGNGTTIPYGNEILLNGLIKKKILKFFWNNETLLMILKHCGNPKSRWFFLWELCFEAFLFDLDRDKSGDG